MLPTKFGVNWPFGYGEEAKLDFQDGGHGGHLGFLIRTILGTFDLQVARCFLPSFESIGIGVRRRSEK